MASTVLYVYAVWGNERTRKWEVGGGGTVKSGRHSVSHWMYLIYSMHTWSVLKHRSWMCLEYEIRWSFGTNIHPVVLQLNIPLAIRCYWSNDRSMCHPYFFIALKQTSHKIQTRRFSCRHEFSLVAASTHLDMQVQMRGENEMKHPVPVYVYVPN